MSQESRIAFILGTGLDPLSAGAKKITLETPHGPHSDALFAVSTAARQYHLLLRHGVGHAIPPHRINYKANLHALKQLGTTHVVSFGAVGVLRPGIAVGDLLIPADFIDLTKDNHTFFDDTVQHTPMFLPFDPDLSRRIVAVATRRHRTVFAEQIYVGVSGPRYSTIAELRSLIGPYGGMLGMTVTHEVILANEIKIRYANCSIATDATQGVSHQEIEAHAQKNLEVVREIIADLVAGGEG